MAVVLVGEGANAAQAVRDTFKVVFQANDNVLAGLSSGGSNSRPPPGCTPTLRMLTRRRSGSCP
jgi:hypothetical protein